MFGYVYALLIVLFKANIAATLFLLTTYMIWKVIALITLKCPNAAGIWNLNLNITILFLTSLAPVVCLVFFFIKTFFFCDISYCYELTSTAFLRVFSLLMVLIWIIGVLKSVVAVANKNLYLWQLVQSGTDTALATLVYKEAEKLNLQSKFTIQENPCVNSPQTACIAGSYTIILPSDIKIPLDLLIPIVNHELEHILHNDHLKIRLVKVASTLFWCNPLIHKISNELDMWIDICRDVAVIRRRNVTSSEYFDIMDRYIEIIKNSTSSPNDQKNSMYYVKNNHLNTRKIAVRNICKRQETVATSIIGLSKVILFSIVSIILFSMSIHASHRIYLEVYRIFRDKHFINETIIITDDTITTTSSNELSTTERIVSLEEFQNTLILEPGIRVVTEEIYLQEDSNLMIIGTPISKSAIDADIRLGYIDENTETSQENTDIYVFNILTNYNGNYRLFAETTSDTSVTIELQILTE